MTLFFQVTIDGTMHEVRLEVPEGRLEDAARAFEECARTTAWLEHIGRLPRGIPKAIA